MTDTAKGAVRASQPRRYEAFGPPTGSSRAVLHRSEHGRIVLDLETDFASVRGIFADQGAREIRDALNELLGDAK